MKHPLVDVVAVSYNHESYLCETLDSIASQTYENFRLHIYDDASTDNSTEEIKRWITSAGADAAFVAHKKNRGLCATLNEALENCSGKYIQFIACDDVIDDEKIAIQVAELEQHPDAAVACSNFSSIDAESSTVQSQYFPNDYQFPANPFVAILEGHQGLPIIIHSPSVLVRRQAILGAGGYRSDLAQEDFYMWLMLSREHKILFNPSVLVAYRVLDSSLSASLISRDREKYLRQHIDVINDLLEKSSLYKNELYSALFARKKSLIEHQARNCKNFDSLGALEQFSSELEDYDKQVASQYMPGLLITYWKNGISFSKSRYLKFLVRINPRYLLPMIFSLTYKNIKG